MKTVQVMSAVCAATLLAGACNRSEPAPDAKQDTREAVSRVRAVADRAGDQLADSWITTKIQSQYFADDDIKARFINVSTRDGVVTLRGRVENERAKEQAVQIARNTDGVKQVHAELAIGEAGGGQPERMEAAWITTQIQAKFFADPSVNGSDIDVTTNNGVVTLPGRVESEREKQEALSLARTVEGVTGVEDRLVVEEQSAVATSGTSAPPAPIDDARVAAAVGSRFFLDDVIKTRRVSIESRAGVVTLRGEVASEDERAQALLLARTTEGVQRVEDSLTVNPSLASAPASSRTPEAAPEQDPAMTETLQTKLAGDPQLAGARVSATMKTGVVVLEGQVPTQAAKTRALSIVRRTPGVVQVIDRLEVGRARR